MDHNFESIYRKTYPTVFGFARRRCHNYEDAEDIAQETFSRAFAAFGTYKHDRPIEHWLIRIAQNAFLDMKRKEGRRPKVLPESAMAEGRGMETVVDPREGADQALERTELPPDMAQAMLELKPDSRQLLLWAYGDDQSNAQIAHRIGIKISTVRSRLHHSCRKVRELVRKRRDETAPSLPPQGAGLSR